MENVGTYILYFMFIWNKLRPFGIFYGQWIINLPSGNLVYFPQFRYIVPRKIWQR
jgi:uncharacterized protein (DUF3820 family)